MKLPGGFSIGGPQSLPVPASIVVDASNGLHTVAGPNPGETIVQFGGELIQHTVVEGNNFLLSWEMNGLRQMIFFPTEAPQMNGMRFDNSGPIFFWGERNQQLQIADATNTTRFIFDPNTGNIALSDGVPGIASGVFINCGISGAKTIGINFAANQNSGFLGLQVRNSNTGAAASGGLLLSNDLTQTFQMNMTSSVFTGAASCGILRLSGNAASIIFHHANPAGGILWSIGNNVTDEKMRLTSIGLGIGITGVSAALHLRAGVAGVNGGPFKYTAGVPSQTILENGAKNFDGTNEYLTAGGTNYTMAKCVTVVVNIDFPSTAPNTNETVIVLAPDAAIGDAVSIGVPVGSVVSQGSFSAYVSAAGLVAVVFSNNSTVAQDPPAGNFRIVVFKF